MDPSHDLKKHIIKCIEELDDLDTLEFIDELLSEEEAQSGMIPPKR